MTKYIFEDKKDDPLSILFQTSYDAEFVNSHFIYSEGNGKIIKNLDELLKSGEDDIFVIMDLIPDNKETCKIYNMILTRQKRNPRIIILPIPCAEYYIIALLYNTGVLKWSDEVANILNRGTLFNTKLIKTEEDRQFTRNFEKLCKLVLNTLPPDCAKNIKVIKEGTTSRRNTSYKIFYSKDCKCGTDDNTCTQITLISKSETLLSLYECFPSNSCIDRVNKLGYADIYHIHCELVDKYNEAVKRYSEENPGGHYNRAEYMYMWDRFKT